MDDYCCDSGSGGRCNERNVSFVHFVDYLPDRLAFPLANRRHDVQNETAGSPNSCLKIRPPR